MRVIKKISNPNWLYREIYKEQYHWGDLNLPYANWNGNASGNSGTQALINSLVWKNGYSQVVDSPTRGDALLDVYLVRLESSFTYSSIVQGISDHYGVMLEVEWEQCGCEAQVERVFPVYNKTDVLGLQTFLRDKFAVWASNSSCVEEIWNNFKNIVYEGIESFVSHMSHIDTGFSWFPCVYKRMLRLFPSFQVATTCFPCSLPNLNFLVTFFSYLCTCKITTATGW